MKTMRPAAVLVTLIAFLFYSCSDSSPIEKENNAEKSVALRTTIFELVKANAVGNRSASTPGKQNRITPQNPFCFEFVYPLVLSYNNGTAVTVNSSEGLWNIINNESPNFFLDSIVFPFQVIQNQQTQTISSEQEFVALINNCGFNNLYDEIHNTYCFDIIFPVSIASNGQITVINSEEELQIFGDSPGFTGQIQLVFPIQVLYQNQISTINSLYEFYQMALNCSNDCVCTQEYMPVCVQTPNGIVEFGNMCYAICAGYTQNDLVPCQPVNECVISNLAATPSACNPTTGTYSLTINFDVTNTTAINFEVFSSSNLPLGSFPITQLPVTIPDYPASVLGAPNLNSVTIRIAGNNEFCTASATFTEPVCTQPCICPTEYNPVCVQGPNGLIPFDNACLALCAGYTQADLVPCQPGNNFNFMELLGTCFHIFYPVTVQHQGLVAVVNSDSELVQYYNPATQTMPIMVYPIAVTWGLQTATFTYNSQSAFEAAINQNCN